MSESKIFLSYNVWEQATFTNKESAVNCKSRQIVNIYIYKYVRKFRLFFLCIIN